MKKILVQILVHFYLNKKCLRFMRIFFFSVDSFKFSKFHENEIKHDKRISKRAFDRNILGQ